MTSIQYGSTSGVGWWAFEVDGEAVLGHVPQVVAIDDHDFAGCGFRGGDGWFFGGEVENPSGPKALVCGGEDVPVDHGAPDVECLDLLPAQPVVELSFSDGPVGVVAFDRNGSSRRRHQRRRRLGRGPRRRVACELGAQVDDRRGDGRRRGHCGGLDGGDGRCWRWWSCDSSSWLERGDEHDDACDEAGRGCLESRGDGEVAGLAPLEARRWPR
ncbi:MAG: hypothetical protein M5T61_16670 [Acidimicrobiia bacterium]|nr:hypothetical protein [Acidimicrobiia bacterium]